MVEKLEAQQAFKCVDCEAISEETGDVLYECVNCGTRFTRDNSADGLSNRCPDCSKFSSKLADQSCVECDEGQVEDIDAYGCLTCGTLYESEKEAVACCAEVTEDATSPQSSQYYGYTGELLNAQRTAIRNLLGGGHEEHTAQIVRRSEGIPIIEWVVETFAQSFTFTSGRWKPIKDFQVWKAEKEQEILAQCQPIKL